MERCDLESLVGMLMSECGERRTPGDAVTSQLISPHLVLPDLGGLLFMCRVVPFVVVLLMGQSFIVVIDHDDHRLCLVRLLSRLSWVLTLLL